MVRKVTIFTFFVIIQLTSSTMMANKWLVSGSNDSGVGSLRECVTLAVEGDTIYVVGIDTIFLTSDQITLTKSINIIGNKTVIKRAMNTSSFRIFNITNGSKIYLEALTIMNGIGPNNKDREHEPFQGGGGIYVNNSLVNLHLFKCSFTQNKTSDDEYLVNGTSSAGYGGGIFIENGNVDIDSCYFGNNSTGHGDVGLSFGGSGGSGGGIYMYNGNLTIKNSTFESNYTGYGSDVKGGNGGDGGAIFKMSGALNITNTKFLNNFTGNGGKGSIYSSGFVTMHYGSGKGGDGGAIYIQSGNNIINNCSFTKNVTGRGGDGVDGASGGDGGSGGAILHYQGKLILARCNFLMNYTGNAGYSGIVENAYCSGSVYCGGGSGGAIFSEYANIFIYNCSFEKNSTGHGANSKKNGSGGAFFLKSSTYDDFLLVNSLFLNNYTTSSVGSTGGGIGGAAYINSWEGNIYNSTFAKNHSAYHGGAIYIEYKSTIQNSILTFNKDQDLSNDIYVNSGGSSVLRYSLIYNQTLTGEGSKSFYKCLPENTNPLFNDTINHDYSLSAFSPCINKGDPNMDTTIFLLYEDLAGHDRIFEIIDIGAFEFSNDSIVTEIHSSSTMYDYVGELRIYPNPAKDIIHLEPGIKQCYYIEIIDLYGRLIYKTEDCLINKFDVSDFPNGIYIIRIVLTDYKMICKKFIKY